MSAWSTLAASFTTASGTKTATGTPAVGDLMVVVVINTGNAATPTLTDNNPDGLGTYTLLDGALKAASADKLFVFVRDALIGSATSTVFTMTPGATSGGGLGVLKLTAMSKVGAAALRSGQTGKQENQGASATPAPAFPQAASGSNPLLGVVFHGAAAGAMTKPASFDTELADQGYSTPTTGVEIVTDAIGNTDTTVTWGSVTGAAFCSMVLEFDATKVVAVAQVTETDTSGILGHAKARAVGQAIQASTAQALGHAKAAGFVGAIEVDSFPGSIRPRKYRDLVAAIEVDSFPGAIHGRKAKAIGAAEEVDSFPGSIHSRKLRQFGGAASTHTAGAIAAVRSNRVAIGQALETDGIVPGPGPFGGMGDELYAGGPSAMAAFGGRFRVDIPILTSTSPITYKASGFQGTFTVDYAALKAAGVARVVSIRHATTALVEQAPPPVGTAFEDCLEALIAELDLDAANGDRLVWGNEVNRQDRFTGAILGASGYEEVMRRGHLVAAAHGIPDGGTGLMLEPIYHATYRSIFNSQGGAAATAFRTSFRVGVSHTMPAFDSTTADEGDDWIDAVANADCVAFVFHSYETSIPGITQIRDYVTARSGKPTWTNEWGARSQAYGLTEADAITLLLAMADLFVATDTDVVMIYGSGQGPNNPDQLWDGVGAPTTIGQALIDHLDAYPPTGGIAFTPAKTHGFVQAVETDVAQPMGRKKTHAFSRATETDAAQVVRLGRYVAVGRAEESDEAQVVSNQGIIAVGIGRAIETDAGHAIKAAPVLRRAVETEAAQPFGVRKAKPFAVATETDLATALGHAIARAVGQIAELDSARPFTRARAYPLGQALEVDQARPFGPGKLIEVGIAIETDTVPAGGIDAEIEFHLLLAGLYQRVLSKP